jgi:hypothetical protein
LGKSPPRKSVLPKYTGDALKGYLALGAALVALGFAFFVCANTIPKLMTASNKNNSRFIMFNIIIN